MLPVEEDIDRMIDFKGKNVLVVGLARSGTGAANLLQMLGARVTINDRKSGEELGSYIGQLSPHVEIITGSNPEELFDRADLIVVSPGVPHDIPALIKAQIKGTPIIGELELAFQTAAGFGLRVTGETMPEACKSRPAAAPLIGVTGTNGKSTVTTLIDLMLKKSGVRTLLGGNIGNALSGEILKAVGGCQLTVDREGQSAQRCNLNADIIVAEISSFQLETIDEFRPKVAVILNISPDHMDRYDGMNEYIDAKARIFENQGVDDFLILNADDPVVMKMVDEKLESITEEKPDLLFFSRKKEVNGVYYKDEMIYCNIPHLPHAPCPMPLISLYDIKIKGVHNLENVMAASLSALISGASPGAVSDVLGEFPGLEHRMEDLGEINGVKFINDSKGTNTGAVAMSLEGLEKVILIMGGTDKDSDFSTLTGLVKERVRLLIIMGEAKDKIKNALGNAVRTMKVMSLDEAVRLSFREATPGDTVLLSPACASFDMFENFEDRGRKFKKAVDKLRVRSSFPFKRPRE